MCQSTAFVILRQYFLDRKLFACWEIFHDVLVSADFVQINFLKKSLLGMRLDQDQARPYVLDNISFSHQGLVCVDALCPSQQFFSHVGMNSCLPGLNQY